MELEEGDDHEDEAVGGQAPSEHLGEGGGGKDYSWQYNCLSEESQYQFGLVKWP